MSNTAEVKITEEQDKYRLDKALTDLLIDLTRSKIQDLINKGSVTSDGKILTDCAHKVKIGEVYIIKFDEPQITTLLPKEIPLDIVYEDDDLIVVNKQAGLTTHPGAGNISDTLVNALLAHCGNNLSTCGKEEMRPGIVHRLDKNTSGLMIVAKNDYAHADLAKQIQDKELTREYLTIAYGVPKPLQGTITANIARNNKDRKKMAIVSIGGKHATTHYEVEEILANGSASLIRCALETGRTHQIRVHLNHIGHPVVGDPEYGNIRSKRKYGLPITAQEYLPIFARQALHSTYIKFTHPVSKKTFEFSCDLPDDMSILISKLKAI